MIHRSESYGRISDHIYVNLLAFLSDHRQIRREYVAVVMTRPLFERLCAALFPTPKKPEEVKMGGCDIRIMEGNTEEWYITAVHGIVPKGGIPYVLPVEVKEVL